MQFIVLKDEYNEILTEIIFQTEKNKLIDIISIIDIKKYSLFLLRNFNRKNEIIEDFTYISNISDWFYNYKEKNIFSTNEEIEEEIYKILRDISLKLKIFIEVE